MTAGQKRSLLRWAHRWLGWAAALFVLIVTLSGIALQHPRWLGPVPNRPLSLAADPANGQRFLRGTHWGVEVSEDGGQHWHEVAMLTPPADVTRILFAPDGRQVYALGTQSLVVSADGGRVWQQVPGPTEDRLLGAQWLDLSISPLGELELLTTVGHFRRIKPADWVPVGALTTGPNDRRSWVHELHTGHLFGQMGRRVAEGTAWCLVVLTVTGLLLHRRGGKRRMT